MRRKKCRKYLTPEMEIEEFDIEDVIVTSGDDDDSKPTAEVGNGHQTIGGEDEDDPMNG